MTTPEQSSLGKEVAYTEQYDPSQLFPIARAPARAEIGVPDALPFFGADIWNGYELSWLNEKGKPQIALLTAMVPADSPFIIESKSFKLYLGSFAQTKLANVDAARALIQQDLSEAAGAPVQVRLVEPSGFAKLELDELDGLLVDRLDIDTDIYVPDASLLTAAFDEAPVDETLVSNLLKSNCPVTGQPDWGTLVVDYRGPALDPASLLAYLVSFRQHQDFHEQCVERIFLDLQRLLQPQALSVYARYVRRGGLDINPYRSLAEVAPDNRRLVRQ